jgi:hypothetical protein
MMLWIHLIRNPRATIADKMPQILPNPFIIGHFRDNGIADKRN